MRRHVLRQVWLVLLVLSLPLGAQTFVLDVTPRTTPFGSQSQTMALPDQLPHSMPSRGQGTIAYAWLAAPTARYAHGVLGDSLEAARLAVRTRQGHDIGFDLPSHRVFEDLTVRLVDLDADGTEEMVVVESDRTLGASLAVYGLDANRIAARARSPFIGVANRWLNPVGAGDFDGDGRLELALVRTPHIGGVLEIYRFLEPNLQRLASRTGYSTHAIGSTELALAAVIVGSKRDLILLPDQDRSQLVLVGLRDAKITELARTQLAGRVVSALHATGARTFAFRATDGRSYQVQVRARY